MESNYEFKKNDFKNGTYCCFDDIMRVGDFDFDIILLDKKLYENSYYNILIYVISYKVFMGAKSMRIRFDKIDGFIKICGGTRYSVLFGPER